MYSWLINHARMRSAARPGKEGMADAEREDAAETDNSNASDTQDKTTNNTVTEKHIEWHSFKSVESLSVFWE